MNIQTVLESGEVLPLPLQIKQVCYLQFRPDDSPFSATVIGVKFHKNTISYDLSIFWDDELGEHETRVYNINSRFVSPM